MANAVDFTFSDLISGYITKYDADQDAFGLKTSDDREYTVYLTPTTFAELIRNLGQGYQDATGQMRDLLKAGEPNQPGARGKYVTVYGIFYPDSGNEYRFEGKHLVFAGRSLTDDANDYVFEKQDWWINQVKQLADFYLESEFGVYGSDVINIDYSNYRTNLTITGEKQKSGRQETDTISRLVYGFASAFLLTGDDRYLEAAEKGTEYLREHLRFKDKSEGIVYWYHAVDIQDDGSQEKVFASEFGDDFNAIPCYEQIYALAGPIQTYRITGDTKILSDAKKTVRLFDRFFKDHSERGGYYSHIDPITFSAHSESLGQNKARKNWNSVGDHAPAYLINLWLATEKEEYAEFLEETFDTIHAHFPDYDESPFVQEKFFEDWSKDQEWGWQQNRAVVGHNLKIAWNLTRMFSLKEKSEYKDLANKIGNKIAADGTDRQRGGWYDVVERVEKNGDFHKYVWHDRKAWWQQEQGILAYYIMAGVYREAENVSFLSYAREGTAFYNAWFLDHYSGGVYFNVLSNGHPYALGGERGKGSHSMAGYHSFELCYLASIYTNLLVRQEPMDFYFKPTDGGFPDKILRVAPDILPPGSIKIKQVWIDGTPYDDFNAKKLFVRLPEDYAGKKIRVLIYPTRVPFEAALLEVSSAGVAKIDLSGNLTGSGALQELDDEFSRPEVEQCQGLTLAVADLKDISSEALRYITFFINGKNRSVDNFQVTVEGATGKVKEKFDDANIGS
ncbi:N-acyl-D-glucosamine 2-epimerase [Crocosphaera sp.]|uniref:AGE family epimerase/isomerase n=1 Tax=Crocosphaera sp. TaxID=2729996 RepID=UPI0026227C27|nr:N-acyl-D-glucosamine 2-epimerase [Crocosphaera sp.]MDJ0581601.1 N-acyl-D-glucosamine 2-epimerase [Crocosphaera sp.]